MSKKTLDVSPTLQLPLEHITQRAALLAVSGAGKSNAARVMAEEFFTARLPFVALDPKGDWWGLRAGADGKAKGGLDVVIFGGKHGDMPLERSGGALVADTVVDQRLSCVVDLSGFESEADRKHFLYEFGRRLYHRNEDPLHLFFEEADDYLPQKPMKDELRLLRVFENIVRRGRSKGLGITLITQRSAVLNKNVLTQVEALFALRTTGPQDIAAIEGWMKYHGADRAMLATLAKLDDGEAWVWSPHYLKKMERFRFRRSVTFDSGATPKNVTQASRKVAATLADVDLGALRTKMAETIERSKAEDPKALRVRIAELEKAARQGGRDDERVEQLEEELGSVRQSVEDEVGALRHMLKEANDALEEMGRLSVRLGALGTTKRVPRAELKAIAKRAAGRSVEPVVRRPSNRPPAASPAANGSPEGRVGKCGRALLGALIEYGDLSLTQAAIATGYPSGAPIVVKTAGELRREGLVEGDNDQLSITEAGRARPELAGVEPLRSGRGLAEHWMSKLGACEAGILKHLLGSYPKPATLDVAAKAAGYEPGQPIVVKSAGKLRTLGLVNGSNEAMVANERLV